MKKKDSYYFPHYYNNKDDASLARLIWGNLGVEGYGIYWILIETLRGADGYRCLLSDLDIIARKYNTDPAKVEGVIRDYGLFKIDGEVFFSSWLSEVMEEVNKLIEKRSEAGKKGNEKRWGSDSNRNAIANRSQTDRNKIKERVNKSKVKGNKTKKNKNTGREYKESLPQLNPGEAFSIPDDTDDQHPLNNPPTHAAHEVAGSAAAFVPPSADEVRTYCEEIGSSIEADAFCDYYTMVGWRKGSTPITDWRAAVRMWEKRGKDGWY